MTASPPPATIQPIDKDSAEAQSANLVQANLEQLQRLFPEAFTEGRIDFDVLKQLLGAAVDEREEKYGLNWHGKRRARQLALTPSTGTLRPCPQESVDWDTTQNLFIEGDNLEVLKLLQKSYAGKVKLIYIDPPYNTGKDFVYPDNFQDSIKNYLELTGQVEGGQKISSNTEASGRFHTDWLNMMYPRLKLARNLLSDDGAILCSIDDIEAPRLRVVMDELFGEENFVAQFAWRTDGNFDNQAKVKVCHEYVLLYAKSLEDFPHPPVVDPSVGEASKLHLPEIRNTIVKNGPKNPVSPVLLPVGFPASFESGVVRRRVEGAWPRYREDAVVQNGVLTESVTAESGWSSKELLQAFIANKFSSVVDGKGQETSFVLTASGAIEIVKKRSDYKSHVISVLNGFGGTQKATAELNELGAFFNGYPKPVALIRYLISMAMGRDGVYLDFFAGSGPTGQAVMELNEMDGGSRRFILVQLPEPLDPENENQAMAAAFCKRIGKPLTVAELTKERLRLAGKRIASGAVQGTCDTGMRVFRLDQSNIRAWDPQPADLTQTLLEHAEHLTPGRTEEDVLYELLLKLGLDLAVPMETRQIAGKTVHNIGAGALFACLSDGITRETAEPLALGIAEWQKTLAPAGGSKLVFKDSAFADDVAKTNLAAILSQHGLDDVRSL